MSEELSVEETVKNIATRILRKPDLDFGPNDTFNDVGADSLDIVQILVAVEDTYDIELDDEEMQEITNVAGFIQYVEHKIGEKG